MKLVQRLEAFNDSVGCLPTITRLLIDGLKVQCSTVLPINLPKSDPVDPSWDLLTGWYLLALGPMSTTKGSADL